MTELLKIFDIPESMLPEVVWSSDRVGEVTTTLGLASVPIAGIAGDQQAALFGQLCLNAGEAKNTYGTGCFLLQNIGNQFVSSKQQLITTLAGSAGQQARVCARGKHLYRRRGGAVAARQSQASSARRPRWSRSRSVKDTGGVVFVPAFVGLGAPHWDPHAGGLIIGLRRDTKPGHIARAALESIAFQVADVLEAMASDTGKSLSALRVDGGAAVNDLLMQFQADLLGVPVVRPGSRKPPRWARPILPDWRWDSGRVPTHFAQCARRTSASNRRWSAAVQIARERWQDAVERSKGLGNTK